ncbi:MAG: PAS domain-containing protein [Bacteroidota bacterium]
MERLPLIINASKTVYYLTITYEGSYVSANSHFLDRFDCHGLVDGSLQFKDTITKDDWPEMEQVFDLCKGEPGKTFDLILRKQLPSGDLVHTSWEFVADETKNEVASIGFDISLRVAYSKKVAEFDERINQIVDGITDGFYLLDKDWRFSLVNQVFLNMLGKSREQLIGKSVWDILPDKNSNYSDFFHEAVNSGEAQKFEVFRPDLNSWFWIAAYPTADGLLVFFKDITERKIERSVLIESRNKLSAILDSTSESHVLIAPDYRIISFNKTALSDSIRLYGKKMTEGMNILEYTTTVSPDLFKAHFSMALSGQQVVDEMLMEFPNQEKKWFRVELSPAVNEDNEIIGVVINSIDIDKLKRYELKLEKSNKQLRAIAFQQSHEMRSSIARVLGLMGLLKESPGDREIMSHVEEVSNELDTIIHDIIDKTGENSY